MGTVMRSMDWVQTPIGRVESWSPALRMMEIWHMIGPLIETPFHGGEATWMDGIFLEINRCGFVEETYFTIAYNSVSDATVPIRIGGALATVHEISEKIAGERRVLLPRALGARSAGAKTAKDGCSIAAETLARYPKDAPFVPVYLIDGDRKLARHLVSNAFKFTFEGEVAVSLHQVGC